MLSKQHTFISSLSNDKDKNRVLLKSNSCKVCGDEARIVNYGALSCQSCKTFFRRNGYRPEVRIILKIYLLIISFYFFL